MKHDSSNSETDSTAGKAKGVDVTKLLGPEANVPTSIGVLFLYGLRGSDFTELSKLTEMDANARVRAFIPIISSLVEATWGKGERQPPSADDISRLSHEEVEAVSEQYLKILLRHNRASAHSLPPQRESDEDAVLYLDRVLKYMAENHHKQTREILENSSKSTGKLERVRKSSSDLGATVNEFERLVRGVTATEFIPAPSLHLAPVMEEHARLRKERREELEMVRLTGKMTAESAKTLKDLAEAATTLLEQLDERDKKADASTRHQVNIAVVSLVISALLAAIALVVALMGFMQDRSNNEAGDKWQAELLDAVRAGTSRNAAAEKQVQSLQDQIANLNAKVQRLESSQSAAALKRKKSFSANQKQNQQSGI